MVRETGAHGTPRGVRIINAKFLLPPGAASVSATGETSIIAQGARKGLLNAIAGRAGGASGHMHLLGKSVRIDLIHADLSEECLLSIPA